MKNKAKEEKRAKPYIFDYYNVKCFAVDPLSASSDVITNLINCVIRAVNENAKLPRHIIVIPENNLVKHFDNTWLWYQLDVWGLLELYNLPNGVCNQRQER